MKNRFIHWTQTALNSQLYLALRGHRALTAAVVLCLMGQMILTLAQPWPVRAIIDYVAESPTISHDVQPSGGIARFLATGISQFASSYNVGFLLTNLSMLLGVYLLNAILLYVQNVGLARLSQQVILRVRGNLFSHLIFLPHRFFDGARTGDLTSRISKDTADIQDMLEALLTVSIRSVPLILGILLVSFTMDWVFALMLVLVVPMAYFANALFMQRTRDTVRSQMRIEGVLASNVQEAFYNHRAVATLSLENEVIGGFLQEGRQSALHGTRAGRLQGILTASMDALVGITSMFVLLVGALRILHGSLTIGQLTIFIAYVNNLFKPIREITKFANRLAKSGSALERIEEIMRLQPRTVRNRRTQ
jgi:ATP-binding cassette subfamily B protein